MLKLTLYIGLNDRITKQQEISTPAARDIVFNTLFEYGIRGFTFHTARGVWQYDDMSVSEESTFVVEIMQENPLPVGVITTLKDALNQESIGVSTERIEVEFL